MTLPIFEVLDSIKASLRDAANLVIIAPPGAGKTTAVAPALLNEAWCTGQILLLSPRRLAARAAAERMAELTGQQVGGTIGYATRLDSRQSAATRILVLTEGIFRNRILADPELPGVSAVLFDEVHERSLDSDFGLALALDAQAVLRPDLRLVAMSATLDGAQFARLMAAPVIESAGRSHELSVRHVGRRGDQRIEDAMAAVIRRALAEAEGDILAFLPGVGEIERTAARLGGVDAEIHRLHGSLDPAEQRAAIHKAAHRKIILATSIAETSLTIDGVRVVVDSGLARRPRYDRAAGTAGLVTERASQAAVTQRAGRAARQAPGVAYRLWEEAATGGLPRFDPPEILESDLTALALDCAIWGSGPETLGWLDPPPASALAEARARLLELDAIDAAGKIIDHGRAIARLPLPPRLAHMLIEACKRGMVALAAEVAVLLSERGLGGSDIDLETRRDRWRNERGKRAEAARGLARRWVALVTAPKGTSSQPSVAACIALAYPDRVARRRDAAGEQWLSVGGRGYRLDPAHPLARAEWLAVGDVQGSAAGARILFAARINRETVETLFAGRIESGSIVRFDPETRSARVEGGRRLGAIKLGDGVSGSADADAMSAALLEGVRDHGLSMIDWPAAAKSLRQRARWAGIDALRDDVLLADLDSWLAPLVEGKRRLSAIDPTALATALRNRLGWDEQQRLDAQAPSHLTSPAGTSHPIDYNAEAGPTVELRVQALFGVSSHPVIGPRHIPLILSLTSPAGRPIQTTRDLPGFWAGSWKDVAKEMRGRYPRYNWPDDPTAAPASLKTKKALDRTRRAGAKTGNA